MEAWRFGADEVRNWKMGFGFFWGAMGIVDATISARVFGCWSRLFRILHLAFIF